MSKFIFAAVLSLVVVGGLFADTVILKNGAAFSGKILFQTSDKIRIRIMEGDSADNGATIEMDFDRKKIKEIIADSPTKIFESKEKGFEKKDGGGDVAKAESSENKIQAKPEPDKNNDAGLTPAGGEDKAGADKQEKDIEPDGEKEAEDKKIDKELFLPEEEDVMLSSFAALLCSDKENERDEAYEKLKAYGKDASQALVDIIGDISLPVESRAAACTLLGDFKDKRTASALVDVLGGRPQSDWLVYGEAWKALKNISGFKMPYHRRAGIQTRQDEYRRWRAWLNVSLKKPEYDSQLSPKPVNKDVLNKDNAK